MAGVPFALLMSEPLTLTLAAVLDDTNPLAELVAVMSPVDTIVPVLALLRPLEAVPLPPVTVLDVIVIVPELALFMPKGREPPLPPVTVLDVIVTVPVLALFMPLGLFPPLPPVIVLEVTVIVPVLALFMPGVEPTVPPVTVLDVTLIVPVLLLFRPKEKPPLAPVTVLAFVISITPAADVDSIACGPFAVVVPDTLPPIATIPLSVNVPLDENAIARVDSVKADPVAWHEASVELAAAETDKQFAEPAWIYAPVIFQFAASVNPPPVAIVSGVLT